MPLPRLSLPLPLMFAARAIGRTFLTATEEDSEGDDRELPDDFCGPRGERQSAIHSARQPARHNRLLLPRFLRRHLNMGQ